MFDPVWQRVVGSGATEPAPAIVDGFQRFCVRGETYPGMVAAGANQVPGMLYTGVSDRQLTLLDKFEGDEYRRVEVTVLLSASAQVRAQAYLYVDSNRLDPRPWDPDRFERDELPAFLKKHAPADQPQSDSGPPGSLGRASFLVDQRQWSPKLK